MEIMPTHCLFHDDAYITQFKARMLDWNAKEHIIEVILDKTAFYATSGGQPHDTGTLNGIEVLDVIWQGEDIIHVLSRKYEEEIKYWELVEGIIDWNRRFDHMQHHTGQHILSRSLLEVNPEAETVSFHLTESNVHIDVAVPEIRETELIRVQELANKVIFEDIEIKTYFTSKEEAVQKKLRKDPKEIDRIRIVEIGEFDIDPCGGTHCKRSGEVGLIFIDDVKKAGRRGNRVQFLCGWRALKTFNQMNQLLKNVQGLLKCKPQDIPEFVQSLQTTSREKEKQIRAFQTQLQTFEIEQVIRDAKATHSRIITKIYDDQDPDEVKRIALEIVDTHKDFIPIFGVKNNPSFIVMARSDSYTKLDLREILKEGLKGSKGKGGGIEKLVQAGGIKPEDLVILITTLERLIKQKI